MKTEGRGLPTDENWPAGDNIVINSWLRVGRIRFHDRYCQKSKNAVTRIVSALVYEVQVFLLHSHHDGSPWQIYLRKLHRSCWGGKLYGVLKSTARAWLQKSRKDGQVGRRWGSGLWRTSSPAQDAALVAEAQRNPFVSARDLKVDSGFPGQKSMVISRFKEHLSGHDKLHGRSFSLTNINYTAGHLLRAI
jgi:hypothetical protein